MRSSLLIVALLIGCASSADESEPAVTAAEAASSFTGTWSGAFTGAGDGVLTLTLRMKNPPPSTKCGSHVLSTKCMDTTTVQLLGTLTTSDGAFTNNDVAGSAMYGGSAVSAWVELASGGSAIVSGTYRDGAFHDGSLVLPSGRAQFKLLARK